ncbi:MAG TPA: TonB-dependent receptor [Bryobacteraceae bacterium]|nr:TonB-dependent receptor [Bryobacteraceae bacterium]
MNKRIYTLLLLSVACLPASAQVDHAALSGTVTDPAGAVVQGATVRTVSTETGVSRETVTGASGTYQIPGLPIGTYDVTVSKDSFKPVEIKGVELAVGQPRTIDATLTVGATADTVQVTAELETLNRTSAEVGGLVEPSQIKEIPVDGRNWASLMLLVPGAVNYGDAGQRAIQFDGHSLDDSNFVFDGIDTSGVQEQTQKADARLNISLDSIAEFRVSTSNYTAEAGAAGGAQVSVVSKSGGNEYHGSGFYALRKDQLDARSPFDGPSLPPFTLNQFGASFGGPVKKDKLFFYANYEGIRQSLGQTFYQNLVPNASYRAQVIATSPALAPLVNAYRPGMTPHDAISDYVTDVATNTVQEDSGMFRLDYQITDKSSAYVRYNIDQAYIDNPSDALGDHNVVNLIPTNVVLQFQHIFSPTTVDEAKVGLNRANYHNWGYGTAPASLTVNSANGFGFDSLSSTSLDTEVGTTFNYLDNLTMVRGRHTLKAGVEIRRIRLNNSGNTLTTQSIAFNSPTDFINNAALSGSWLQGEGVVGNRRTFAMGYLQDDFKVTSDLTLNLGLRYEYYSVAHEILNRSAVVDITPVSMGGCAGYCPKGTPYYDPNPLDFGPRFGLAWAPRALGGKTTIRTGFGIYYGGNQNDDFSDPAESAVPRYSWTSTTTPNLSYPLTPFLNPALALYSPKAIFRHRKDLSYNNYDFMIQQDVGKGFVAQVGYQGSQGHHLFDKYTVNLINPATGTRPLSAFSSFGMKTNDGNNNFNSMQASIHRLFAHGLLFQANYMWSHGITDASDGSGTSVSFEDMGCRACDRSSSDIDVRQTLLIDGVWELPFGPGKALLADGLASKIFGGWSLSGIAGARSGLPINITVSRKAAAMPDGNTSSQRPNYVLGQSLYAANQSIPTVWFNPAAFATPANGTWGNLGRYDGRGPNNYEIDTGLQKRFRVSERVALNFRASAFNLFNNPQWSNPSGNSSSSNFGKITSILNTGATGTGAPRRIEFMFRAEF